MNNDINNICPKLLEEDDRIVSFLKGEMTDAEEQQFLKDVKERPELKEKAVSMARLIKGLKQVGTERDQRVRDVLLSSSEQSVKKAAQNVSQTGSAAMTSATAASKQSPTISWRKASMWLSVAASLFLVVWLGIGYNDHRNTVALGEQYGDSFTTQSITRGADKGADSGANEAEAKLNKLYADIKNKQNLDNAIHELSLCWELSTMETYNDYTEFSPEIGWNLAIAHLKNGDRKQAKAVLQKLTDIAPAGTAIDNQARELLNKVKEL